MRELKLFADTVVQTSTGPKLASKAEFFEIIDSFGGSAVISAVKPSGKSKAVLVQLMDHGDPFVLPADALVMPRTPEDARYAPVAAASLDPKDHYFLLPSRKLTLSPDFPSPAPLPPLPTDIVTFCQSATTEQLIWLLQFLEYVEGNDPEHVRRGLVLKFDDIFQARLGGELLGLYGIKVFRHPTRPWVYPDQRRPSCAVSKLLAGVLHGEAARDVLFEFYGKGILQAVARVDETLIAHCMGNGVLAEGQPVENLVKVHQVRVSERERETVTLQITRNAHVETTWAQI